MRPASEADLARLVELESVHAGDSFTADQIRYLLTRANAVNLVAEDPRPMVIGNVIVLLRRGSRGAHLYSLTVDPDMQGRGVARGLLAAAEAIVTELGAERMKLEVRTDNDRAHRLYEAAGYRETGTREDYYWDGCDAIVMEKRLLPGDR